MDRADEKKHAMSGALAIGLGYAAAMVIAALVTCWVPGTLGASDFGLWVLFRSIGTLLIGITAIGTAEVMVRYYVAFAAQGDQTAAVRLFKMVVVVRLGLVLLAAVAGGALLVHARNSVFDDRAGVCLGASMLLQAISLLALCLLYGERQLARIAILNALGAGMAPVVMVLFYLRGGFAWVPAGCVAGDGLLAAISLWLCRPFLRWVPGWLSLREIRPLLQFAGATALAATGFGVFSNIVPYLMDFRGMDGHMIGLVGLATRLSGLVSGALLLMSGSMFAYLAVAMEKEGLGRVLVWQSLMTRLGVVLALGVCGVFLLLGRVSIRLVWGPEFEAAEEVTAICLAAVPLLWVGFQYCHTAMIIKQSGIYARAVFWLVAIFLGCFFGLARRLGVNGVALSILGGTLGFMLSAAIEIWVATRRHLALQRLAAPLGMVLLAIPLRPWTGSVGNALVVSLIWGILYLAVVLAAGCLRRFEIAEIWQLLTQGRQAAGVRPGIDDAGSAPGA